MLHDKPGNFANEWVVEWRQAFLAGNTELISRLYADDAFFYTCFLNLSKRHSGVGFIIVKLIAHKLGLKYYIDEIMRNSFVIYGSHLLKFLGNTIIGKWDGSFVQQRGNWVLALHMTIAPAGQCGPAAAMKFASHEVRKRTT